VIDVVLGLLYCAVTAALVRGIAAAMRRAGSQLSLPTNTRAVSPSAPPLPPAQ